MTPAGLLARITTMTPVLGLVFAPVRYVLRQAGGEISTPLEETEEKVLDAVRAIHRATDSIEHHVEVIEGLATSVGPLTASVDALTQTMRDLVILMAPMAAAERGAQKVGREVQRAEHEVQRVERFFSLHRRKNAVSAGPGPGSNAVK